MLRAVANPAAGGQPGSFTSLTATSLTVNGLSTMTANSASPAIDITQNGAGFSLRTNSPAQINGYLDVQGAIYASADAYVTGSISATASVRPQGDPDTNWGIDFAQSNAVPNFLTLADAATYDLAVGSGFIILHSNTTGSAGVFLAAAGAVSAIADPNSQFSTSSGTPSKINIYYNGSTAYRIQNNTGGAIELFVGGIRTRTNT